MRIGYLCTRYNWDSYSEPRSIYETLEAFGVKVEMAKSFGQLHGDFDMIWVASSLITLEKRNCPVIVFGLSDPNLYMGSRAAAADIYITSSLQIHENHGYYYMPPFCDLRYFNVDGPAKKYDVAFFGAGKHKFSPERIELVARLREAGVSVHTFGKGWLDYPGNHGFLSGPQLVDAMQRTRLCVDIRGPECSMSSRIFQASACGTPVITPLRRDTMSLFLKGEDILTYEDTDDLIAQCKQLLADETRLRQIGIAAHMRCIQHDVRMRLAHAITHIWGHLR